MRAKIIVLLFILSMFAFAVQTSLASLVWRVTVNPWTQTRIIGEQAQFVATFVYNAFPPIINDSVPWVNTTVGFVVVSGPNQNLSGTAITNAQGQATFNYTGFVPGIDTIRVYDLSGITINWVALPNVIPEVPFGTILLVVAMLSSCSFYVVSKRRKKI